MNHAAVPCRVTQSPIVRQFANLATTHQAEVNAWRRREGHP